MNDLMGSFFVPMFFITATLATLAIGLWIGKQKNRTSRLFGSAMVINSIGFGCWAAAATIKPDNLTLFIGLGVVPLLIGHYVFLQVHLPNYKAKYQALLTVSFIALAIFTLVFRSVIRPSDPYFSPNGLLYFNIDPVTSWLYIAIFSIARLPAILAFCNKIKHPTVKFVLQVNCFTLFICSIILVTSNNDQLLTINGFVMAVSYIMTVFTSIKYPKFSLLSTAK